VPLFGGDSKKSEDWVSKTKLGNESNHMMGFGFHHAALMSKKLKFTPALEHVGA
jgi:hypothetical protein